MPTHKRRKSPPPRIVWRWLAIAAVALLALGGLVFYLASGPAGRTYTPEYTGGPHLTVDQTAVDHGDVAFGQRVRSSFGLSNTGDRPLLILRQPEVELVEGC